MEPILAQLQALSSPKLSSLFQNLMANFGSDFLFLAALTGPTQSTEFSYPHGTGQLHSILSKALNLENTRRDKTT